MKNYILALAILFTVCVSGASAAPRHWNRPYYSPYGPVVVHPGYWHHGHYHPGHLHYVPVRPYNPYFNRYNGWELYR